MKIANNLILALFALACTTASSAALAASGHAANWQLGLLESVTPVADDIHFLHNVILMPIITVITLFVLGLLIYVMVKFNAKANPVPSRTTHNTLVEVLWTVIPIVILVVIAIPSFRLVYFQRNIPNNADMTLKIIGQPSWSWTYEYPDLGTNEDGTAKVSFSAYLKKREDAAKEGVPYLLATDVPVVVPVNKTVKLIVTSDPDGIIHAWTIQSFGLKIDAVPGRLNEDWFRVVREGVYYGQCSELCGKDHAFMPIEVWVVAQDKYEAWAALQKTAPDDATLKSFLNTIKPSSQLAQN
jgi:cytochrome c oxidase subunit 2